MYFGNEEKTAIFLERLVNNGGEDLTIIITKSTARKTTSEENKKFAEGNNEVSKLLESAMKIDPDYTEIYKIHFEDYLIFQTRFESYALCDFDDGISKGKGLIIFEKSRFMDYAGTVVNLDLAEHMQGENQLKHYGIYTVDQVIDVITFHEPIIEQLSN